MAYRILHKIPDEHMRCAAHLHFDAFEGKIGGILGRDGRGHNFFADIINPHFGVCAVSEKGDVLLGVAGFKTSDGGLINGRFKDLQHHYGLFGALWRGLILSVLERAIEPDTLLMDGIAVAPDQRGQGVGTHLLNAIEQEAKERGKTFIRLDVIDINPRAKALYERQGFKASGEETLGPLKYIFGFEKSTTMTKQVNL